MGLDPLERGYEFYRKGSGASKQKIGGPVAVDITAAIEMLNKVGEAMAGKMLMVYGAGIMQHETDRAFAAGIDPSTEKPWPPRKYSYPWPILRRTNNLQASLEVGWGLKTKDGKPRFFGKAREGSYLGKYSAGRSTGRRKPIAMVAAAVHFGRKGGRSGSDTRTRKAAATGQTPPRALWGWGNSARNRLVSRAQQLIERAAK